MKPITLNLPEPYIKALNELVKAKFYPNRAEAIRIAVRDLIQNERFKDFKQLSALKRAVALQKRKQTSLL